MTKYVGLDVHSKMSVFVIQDEDGKIVGRGEIPTSAEGMRRLRDENGLPAGTKVALETGTVAFFAARKLSEVGLTPIVVDAHEVRIKAHRPTQKSDRRDALELCEGIRRNSLSFDRARAAGFGRSVARVTVAAAPLRASSDLRSERGEAVVTLRGAGAAGAQPSHRGGMGQAGEGASGTRPDPDHLRRTPPPGLAVSGRTDRQARGTTGDPAGSLRTGRQAAADRAGRWGESWR